MIEWEEKPEPPEFPGHDGTVCCLKVLRGGRLVNAQAEDVGKALAAMPRDERVTALDIALERKVRP